MISSQSATRFDRQIRYYLHLNPEIYFRLWGHENQRKLAEASIQVDFNDGIAHPVILECCRNLLLVGIGNIIISSKYGELQCDTSYYLTPENKASLEAIMELLKVINPDSSIQFKDRVSSDTMTISASPSPIICYEKSRNCLQIASNADDCNYGVIGSVSAQLIINIITGIEERNTIYIAISENEILKS